jgi:cytochrome c
MNKRRIWAVFGAGFGLLLGLCRSAEAGDLKVGQEVFSAECAECHSVRDGKQKKGPSVFGVMGRKAATVQGFDYSEALRKSEWVWDTERMRFYLQQPAKKANPGGKMKYEGLVDPVALDALLEYLQSLK